MSFDAYKVAVKLSLVNNVTTGLLAITSQLHGVNKGFSSATMSASLLEKKLHDIKRLGLIGGAMAATGVGMLAMFKGPVEKAIEWEREAAKMRQMGLGVSQIAEAQKFVTATNIMGVSMQERMKLFVEAQGAFRESGKSGAEALEAAKTMMPILAQYQNAMGVLGGGKNSAAHEGSMRSLNKTIEIMGGLGNTARATAIADGVFKAVQSSGKMVDERQLKQFVAYGSSATNQLNLRTIFGALEPIIGELGGSTTAVGLRTAYTRTNGMMSMPPKLMLHEMQRLGMTDSTGRKQNSALADMQSTNVVDYAIEIMKRYKSAGINSQVDRERENAVLFGTNGSKVYNKLMAQLPVIEESLKAYDQAKGIIDTNRSDANSPMMAIKKFHAALDDLGLVIGQAVLPTLTQMMQTLSALIKPLNQYPTLVSALTIGFVGLGVAMAIGGTITLITAGFSGLGLALSAVAGAAGIGAVGVALAGLAGPIAIAVLGIATISAALLAFKPLTKAEIEAARTDGGVRLTKSVQDDINAGKLNTVRPGASKANVTVINKVDRHGLTTMVTQGMGKQANFASLATGTDFDMSRSVMPVAGSWR